MRRTAIFLIPLLAAMVLAGATGPARAQVVALDVDYEHGDTALQGVLAYDDAAEGKLPGVLVVHEWYGLNEHSINTAKRLASLGYAAFAVDMYGAGVLAENNEQAAELAQPFYKDRQLMRDRAMAGYDALVGAGMVDKARVFAMGYCFGGSTVLELARSGAPLSYVAQCQAES